MNAGHKIGRKEFVGEEEYPRIRTVNTLQSRVWARDGIAIISGIRQPQELKTV